MQSDATTIDDYISGLAPDRKEVIEKLRAILKDRLPAGFKETMSYGHIGYVVPHNLYPSGYHCDPKLPLPFLSIASQKNFIAFYHMGIYADQELLDWFVAEFPKHSSRKLDMGKSCIRFKKLEDIPYELLGELAAKMSPQAWIEKYESAFKPSK